MMGRDESKDIYCLCGRDGRLDINVILVTRGSAPATNPYPITRWTRYSPTSQLEELERELERLRDVITSIGHAFDAGIDQALADAINSWKESIRR
jgi:hypothetical protein